MATLDEMLSKLPPKRLAHIQKMADEMIMDYQLQLLHEELQTSQQQLADAMGIS